MSIRSWGAVTLLALAITTAGCADSHSGRSSSDSDAPAPASLTASTDTGSSDAGASDAGSSDAGSSDAGSTDAGSTDAGSTDAGSSDAASSSSAPFAVPSGPAVLSIRQLYATNIPSADIPPPNAGGSSTPSATDQSDYAHLDCSLPSNRTERSAADVANQFLAACGAPDGSPVWYKFLLYPATITSDDIVGAQADDGFGDNQWAVSLRFTTGAAKTWAAFTGSHIQTTVAIVINGRVFSAEVIQSEITGPTEITGNLSAGDAKALAGALASGLPAS